MRLTEKAARFRYSIYNLPDSEARTGGQGLISCINLDFFHIGKVQNESFGPDR